MIVEENDGGRIRLSHVARDLARGRVGDRAAGKYLRADETVTRVEEQEAEDLVRQRADRTGVDFSLAFRSSTNTV
jgi:hypothetical protein